MKCRFWFFICTYLSVAVTTHKCIFCVYLGMLLLIASNLWFWKEEIERKVICDFEECLCQISWERNLSANRSNRIEEDLRPVDYPFIRSLTHPSIHPSFLLKMFRRRFFYNCRQEKVQFLPVSLANKKLTMSFRIIKLRCWACVTIR